MKERPILFNTSMVRAIVEGRKTQTRRVLKQPIRKDGAKLDIELLRSMGVGAGCPIGQVGDRLWVRETHAYVFRGSSHPGPFMGREKGVYCETSDDDTFHIEYAATCKEWDWEGGWRPSIHMPRWASRISLEINDVRIERLQDIGEADARAEGVQSFTKDGRLHKFQVSDGDYHWADMPRDPITPFRHLWVQLNGEDSWAENPWVWVIEFKKV